MAKRVFWKYERRMVRAMAEVILPLDAASPDMGPLLDRLEKQLWLFAWYNRVGWRAGLWFLELLAFLYHGRCRPMSFMNTDLRRRYLDYIRSSRWLVTRVLSHYLNLLIFVNYYSIPHVEQRVGYIRAFEQARPSPSLPAENLVLKIPTKDVSIEADVCVIGSGAGGAFAAMALAQAGRKVVILEEGGYFEAKDFGHDALTMTRMLYREAGGVVTLGWPPILVPLGCCVGGTTVINSGTCHRPPPKIFHWWMERFGLSTWSPERMETYYQWVEELLEVKLPKDEFQGASGKVFARGFQKLGAECEPLPRNVTGCSGSGVCCWGCPTNAKKSMQLNAIPLALEAGAHLYARCQATRITFKRHHVMAVMARFVDPHTKVRGPKLTVKSRAVVVSCGTFRTPVLLGRSGIPDPSRQRGLNLTLHPATKVIALMDEEVRGWKGIPQGLGSNVLVEEGIKLEGVFLPPAYTTGPLLLAGQEHRETMENYNRLAAFGLIVSDDSRGRVVRGPGGQPIIFYNLRRADVAKFQRGITYLVEAVFAAGAKKVFPGIYPMPVITRDQGASAIAHLMLKRKDLDLYGFHPLGTCRMGADPREAVLDSTGRVYGLDNLFVADGSIFPTPLGVNPQTTIMAAALKIADHINREYL